MYLGFIPEDHFAVHPNFCCRFHGLDCTKTFALSKGSGSVGWLYSFTLFGYNTEILKNKNYMQKTQQIARAFGSWVAVGAIMFLATLPIVKSAAYSGNLQAYGTDTIAGYSALLSTSKTTPDSDVVFVVQKPDGAQVKIPTKTNNDGVAKLDLYDYHTRRAGTYSVMAYPSGSSASGTVSYFSVYADEVSSENSEMVAQTTVARATGSDRVYLTATLRDQYGNSFEGHSLNVISSRPGDTVKSTGSGMTDSNGSATFYATAYEPGVSVFSAFDSTSGMVLNSRAQVAFLSGDSYLANAGGDFKGFIPLASAASAGPLHHFEISDIPATVNPNQNVSFRVTAQDQNDITVENYTGKVRFSAQGANSTNVTLPEDYTFKAEDLGTHEFSLGLKFTTAGTYTVSVNDIGSPLIEGEKAVVVGSSGSSGSQSGSSSGQKPSVITPVSGTYSQNVQSISGSAPSGTTVKIFDNDQEIGSVAIGSGGSYAYQTAPLADGDHSIYVVTADAGGTVLQTSETVTVTIDTTPPSVDEVIIEPVSGIKTGDVITVKVLSEPNLSEAALVFNAEIFELSPSLDQDGMYVSSLQAPANPGEYPLDILLVDELGNEATYKDEALVTITTDGTGSVTQEPSTETPGGTQETVAEPAEQPELISPPSGDAPSQVFGVIVFGSDGRITLVWEAANDDGTIDHYKIYYGLDPVNLSDSVDTMDASTTWYVPGLENGKEYYFAVSAVDNDGLESAVMSELVNGIPFKLEVEAALPGRPDASLGAFGEDALLRGAAAGEIPPEMVKNGPELLWLLVGTGLASGTARHFSRRKRRK